MAKVYRWLLIIFIGTFAAISFGGYMLSDHGYVERSHTIQQPRDVIYPLVSNPENFVAWAPWFEADPRTQFEHRDADQGLGAKTVWRSGHPQVGVGSLEVIDMEAPTIVQYHAIFEGANEGTVTFLLTPQPGGATTVTWSYLTVLDTASLRYFGLVMDRVIGEQFEKGFAALEAQVNGS